MRRRRHRLLFALVVTGALSGVVTATALADRPAPTSDPSDHRASPPGGQTRDEPSVASDPRRPQVLATAANDFGAASGVGIAVYRSSDGGLTYPDSHVMPIIQESGYEADPHLAFDGRGRLYAAYLSYNYPDLFGRGGLAVARSDDGGRTWPDFPAVVVRNRRSPSGCSFADFPALAVDRRPGHEAVYTAWQSLEYGDAGACSSGFSHPLYVSRSTDAGVHWSRPVALPGLRHETIYLPSLTVGPDGAVLATYDSLADTFDPTPCPSAGHTVHVNVARSTDGGRHFSRASAQAVCAQGTPVFVSDPVLGSYLASSTGATYRLPVSTNTVADPRTGVLVNVAGGQDPLTGQQLAKVALSSNGGRSWRPGGVVPASPSENQQYPRLAVGRDGRVSLVWIAQLPGGLLWASHAWSFDDGVTWSAAERIAAQPSRITTPFWLGFIGDYIGNDVGTDGRAHPVWTDLRETQTLQGGTLYTRALAPVRRAS